MSRCHGPCITRELFIEHVTYLSTLCVCTCACVCRRSPCYPNRLYFCRSLSVWENVFHVSLGPLSARQTPSHPPHNQGVTDQVGPVLTFVSYTGVPLSSHLRYGVHLSVDVLSSQYVTGDRYSGFPTPRVGRVGYRYDVKDGWVRLSRSPSLPRRGEYLHRRSRVETGRDPVLVQVHGCIRIQPTDTGSSTLFQKGSPLPRSGWVGPSQTLVVVEG